MYLCSSQTLLPVLPKLAVELQVDDEAKRRSALELLGKLLSQPGSDIDRAYPDLLSDFLGRTVDQKVCHTTSSRHPVT